MKKLLLWLVLPMGCYFGVMVLVPGFWKYMTVATLMIVGGELQDRGRRTTWGGALLPRPRPDLEYALQQHHEAFGLDKGKDQCPACGRIA